MCRELRAAYRDADRYRFLRDRGHLASWGNPMSGASSSARVIDRNIDRVRRLHPRKPPKRANARKAVQR